MATRTQLTTGIVLIGAFAIGGLVGAGSLTISPLGSSSGTARSTDVVLETPEEQAAGAAADRALANRRTQAAAADLSSGPDEAGDKQAVTPDADVLEKPESEPLPDTCKGDACLK
jgi:hypothetical protein